MTARTKAGAKAKGARFENEIARQCKAAFPGADVWTGRQRKQGHGLPDVAVGNWLHLECKNQDRVSWLGALRQAIRDSDGTGRIPIAVIKDARCKRGRRVPVVAVMRNDNLFYDIGNPYTRETGARFCVPEPHESQHGARPRTIRAFAGGAASVTSWDTNPRFAAVPWLWLRDEVLAPLWKAGNAGKGGA